MQMDDIMSHLSQKCNFRPIWKMLKLKAPLMRYVELVMANGVIKHTTVNLMSSGQKSPRPAHLQMTLNLFKPDTNTF